MQWLRLYTEIINDLKIATMSEKYRWRYIALLCIHRNNGEKLPNDEQIAFILRLKLSEWLRTKEEFQKRNLLENDKIHGWQKRQFISDNVTARVKIHRQKETLQKQKCNVSETPSETETDTDILYNHQASPVNISISDSNTSNNSISILLRKEFGEDVDVNFYLENYITDKIREPLKYLQKVLRNEDGKIRRIKKPLEKSIPIPEGYQIILDSSSKICSKCHNPMTRISKERTDEVLLFCEYCGSMEAEKINLKLIHQVMQEAKKTINEQKTIN